MFDSLFALVIDLASIDWTSLVIGVVLPLIAARVPQLAPYVAALTGLLHPKPLNLAPAPLLVPAPAPPPPSAPLTIEQFRQLLRQELSQLLGAFIQPKPSPPPAA